MNGTLPSSSTHSPYTSYPCISQPELHVEVRLVAPEISMPIISFLPFLLINQVYFGGFLLYTTIILYFYIEV